MRIQRRQFIKGSGAALGLGALGLAAESEADAPEATGPPRIRSYPKLGRTGLEISDISYGSSRTDDPAVVRHAFERGINYFDSAEGYQRGRSESSIGQALEGHRKDVVITSKTKCGASTTEAELMAALEGSLRRLRTDYIDIYFNHAVNDIARLQNDAWQHFADKAKAQGKIRFTGMSGHAGQLAACLDHALDRDLFDVVLVGYNFGQDPAFYQRFVSRLDWVAVQQDLPRVLAKAKSKDVGVVAMKTLRGARLNDMRPFERKGGTFAQAAFRWVLSSPNVDALVVSMTGTEQIDEYVGASGARPPKAAQLDLLEEYLLSEQDGYCDHGCEACHASCPAGVPINEVLRTRMYAVDYRDHAYARDEYARVTGDASACASCTSMPCLDACPRGLEVGRLTRAAHRLLG